MPAPRVLPAAALLAAGACLVPAAAADDSPLAPNFGSPAAAGIPPQTVPPPVGGAASVAAGVFAAGAEYPASPNRYVPGYGYAPPTGLSPHFAGPTWVNPVYSDGYAFGQRRYAYPFDPARGAGVRADAYGGPFYFPGSPTNYSRFGVWPPLSPGFGALNAPTGPPFTGTGIGGWPGGVGSGRPLGAAF